MYITDLKTLLVKMCELGWKKIVAKCGMRLEQREGIPSSDHLFILKREAGREALSSLETLRVCVYASLPCTV